MQTAPSMGRLADEKSDVRDNVLSSKPQSSPQQKSHAALRLNRLTAKLDALAVWRDDLADRIDRAMQMQDAGCLFHIEIDDLADAVRVWRLAAARVALDLDAKPLGDVRRAVA